VPSNLLWLHEGTARSTQNLGHRRRHREATGIDGIEAEPDELSFDGVEKGEVLLESRVVGVKVVPARQEPLGSDLGASC
jgi:hypothetical protein